MAVPANRPIAHVAWRPCVVLSGMLFAVLAVACGPRSSFEPQVRHDFPPIDALVAERSVPVVRAIDSRRSTSDDWELRLLPRGDAGNVVPPTMTLTESEVASRFEYSQADLGLRCVALEVAHRFDEGVEPTLDELAWLGERCGVGAAMDVRYVVGRGGEAATAELMVETGVPNDMPIYFGAGRLVADAGPVYAIAWGRASGYVRPFPTSGEVFTVEGRAHSQYHWVQAAITRGDTRVARCRPDTTVALPEFRFECVGEISDDEAVIELWAGDWRRLIGQAFMVVRVSPSGAEPTRYLTNETIIEAAEHARVTDSIALLVELEALVTEVRTTLGLGRMHFEREQSEAGLELLRLIISDWLGPTPGALRNGLLQGMLAGYELSEEVMGGRVIGMLFSERLTTTQTLDRLMDYPRTRLLLVNEEIDLVAVALGGDPDARMTGVLLAGWQDGSRASSDFVEERLLERIDQWREDRGLDAIEEPVSRFVREARSSVQAIARGAPVPSELDSVTRRSTVATNRASGAAVYELLDPETFDLRFMADILSEPDLRATVAAARWDDPESRWGTYVVILLYERPQRD